MIQIDMPMPKNCLDCPACNEYLMCAIPINGRKWGENDVREFGQGRPEWCPLKEQEAVEPIPPTDESDLWRCGNCNHQLFRCTHQRYCEMCGKPVKWEGMRWFFCNKCFRWHRTYPATVMYCPFCGADITEQESR